MVTPEGLPLAYEVLPGNTADNQTLRQFLSKIETQYGKARRTWVMDRGIPSEAVLAETPERSAGALSGGHSKGPPDPVGEASPRPALAGGPWRVSRSNCWPRTASSMRLAQSADRVLKERAMRRRQPGQWLWQRLNRLAATQITREQLR